MSAALITATPSSARLDDATPLVIDVDPRQAVFAGPIVVNVTRLAERLEIVLAGGPQPDGAAHAQVTAALLTLAHGTLPHAAVEALPAPAAAAGPQRMIRQSTLPGVRIRLPMPATDDVVRDSVSQILAAVNSRRYGDDTIGARVISIDHVFAGCTPFDTLMRNAARARVDQLALMLGTPSPTGLSLRTVPAARPFEVPAEGMPHCIAGAEIFPDASLSSSASYSYRQNFAFAQPIRFAAPPALLAHNVWALWSGPMAGPRLRLRAPGVLLTVEGYTALERRPAFGDTCAAERHALAGAVADAQARAQRIARGLGASIDLAPVAVRIGAGFGFAPCTDRGMEFASPAPLSAHISGELQLRELENDKAVNVLAVYRISHPQFSGVVRSQVTSDDPTSITARFGYVAPPIDYPAATHEGDAQLETRLAPQYIRVDLTLSPDNRHDFHAIDPGLAAGLAATLGASAVEFTAAMVPDRDRGSGTPTRGRMNFEAELPNRGPASEHALNAALASAQSSGYGGFSIVSETNGCSAVDDALALDAIRAAARNTTPSERRGRVVAIDLRGPFTVEGLCTPTNSGVATWAVRNAKIKDVRLAAYARISYGP